MLDFNAITLSLIEKHGAARIAEVTGAKPTAVQSWIAGNAQPNATHLTALLAFDPDCLHKLTPLYPAAPEPGNRLAICMNTNRAIDWRTMQSITKLYDSTKMQVLVHPTNFLVLGRNQLARRFLESGCEWSLWVDDDVVLPCGDAEWFRIATNTPQFPETFAGLNTIGRLLNAQKNLIGGCYFDRQGKGKAQFKEAASDPAINRDIHQRGPRGDVRVTKWVAAGCLLVNRRVFEDIARQDLAPKCPASKAYLKYQYGFFDPLDTGLGEDVSFCLRAEKAGHPCHVDLAVMPGHVGPHVFTAYNS